MWNLFRILALYKNTKGKDFLKSSKVMTNKMTRKQAATIMKKYEKNGMIGLNVKEEYFTAKKIYNEIVKKQN